MVVCDYSIRRDNLFGLVPLELVSGNDFSVSQLCVQSHEISTNEKAVQMESASQWHSEQAYHIVLKRDAIHLCGICDSGSFSVGVSVPDSFLSSCTVTLEAFIGS